MSRQYITCLKTWAETHKWQIFNRSIYYMTNVPLLFEPPCSTSVSFQYLQYPLTHDIGTQILIGLQYKPGGLLLGWSYKPGGLLLGWSYKPGGLLLGWSYKPCGLLLGWSYKPGSIVWKILLDIMCHVFSGLWWRLHIMAYLYGFHHLPATNTWTFFTVDCANCLFTVQQASYWQGIIVFHQKFCRIFFAFLWQLQKKPVMRGPSKSYPTWQVSPHHRCIPMLKYDLVNRKC